MCIVVIGGMDRLGPHYREEAKRLGITLRLLPRFERDMHQKLSNSDGVVLFTGKISHAARREAINATRRHNIPLYQFHACGLCTLRDCLRCCATGAPNAHAPGRQTSPGGLKAFGIGEDGRGRGRNFTGQKVRRY